MFPTAADLEELGLAPLPSEVQTMLRDEGAPPRLVAHLVLVHDVAVRLLRGLWECLALEDVLVVLADNVWKGKRSRKLDDVVALAVASATGAPAWEVFMHLDEILSALAADADARLAWQGRFPVSVG